MQEETDSSEPGVGEIHLRTAVGPEMVTLGLSGCDALHFATLAATSAMRVPWRCAALTMICSLVMTFPSGLTEI